MLESLVEEEVEEEEEQVEEVRTLALEEVELEVEQGVEEVRTLEVEVEDMKQPGVGCWSTVGWGAAWSSSRWSEEVLLLLLTELGRPLKEIQGWVVASWWEKGVPSHLACCCCWWLWLPPPEKASWLWPSQLLLRLAPLWLGGCWDTTEGLSM